MLNIKDLSKIGIGAWGLGGFAERNLQNDDTKQIEALVYALQKGINLLEINMWNAQGAAAELEKQAIDKSGIKREDLFITQAIYNYTNPTLHDAKKEVETVLQLFHTDYIDTVEFSLSAFPRYGFDEIVDFMKELLAEGKIRYTSITNANLAYLKKYHDVFGEKVFSHEVHYSFEVRENESQGILQYATNHHIKNIIYQPLRRNRTALHNWPLLVELAEKYQKTQNQIILQWMIAKGYLPLIKSETTQHIDENLAATIFTLSQEDQQRMDAFHIDYDIPKIDWFMEHNETTIFMLPNIFEDLYAKHR